MIRFVLFLLLPFSVFAQIEFIEKPLPTHCYYERKTDATIEYVVLHFCSDVVMNPQNPFQIERIYEIFSEYKVSSHYLIDRDGSIYRFVNEAFAAKHASYGSLPNPPYLEDELNHYSIGIEMFSIGTKEEMRDFFPMYFEEKYNLVSPYDIGFTDAQYDALNLLLADIYQRNPNIPLDRQHIIGHNEYQPYRRTDPGSLFDWSRIGY